MILRKNKFSENWFTLMIVHGMQPPPPSPPNWGRVKSFRKKSAGEGHKISLLEEEGCSIKKGAGHAFEGTAFPPIFAFFISNAFFSSASVLLDFFHESRLECCLSVA